MNLKKTLLFCCCVLLLQSAQAHKFYASLTEVSYNPSSQSLELILKFFVDDFEEALDQMHGKNLSLGTPMVLEQADSLIALYTFQNFELLQEGIKLNPEYIGYESDKDYVWIYFEIKSFDPDQKHQLEMSMLCEVFEEQSNQINLDINGLIDSFTLHRNETTIRF